MSKQLRAGLDFSGAGLTFAVLDGEKVLLDEFIPTEGRKTSDLPVQVSDLLSRKGLSFDDVTEWSAGAGPGSFTGLRLAAAFILGLTFGRNEVRTRCVSTAAMIAANSGSDAAKILVFFDGRKNELIAFGLEKIDSGYREDGFSAIIANPDQAQEAMTGYGDAAAFARDHDAVRAALGAVYAENVRRVNRLSAVPLVRFEPENFTRPLTDLVYLRPAVFVEAKKIREIPL